MKAPGNLENKKTRKNLDFHVVRRVHTQFARVGAVFELEAERNHRRSVAPHRLAVPCIVREESVVILSL